MKKYFNNYAGNRVVFPIKSQNPDLDGPIEDFLEECEFMDMHGF
jgi:hypothetical protein